MNIHKIMNEYRYNYKIVIFESIPHDSEIISFIFSNRFTISSYLKKLFLQKYRLRGNPFSTYAKLSEKLTFFTP